MANFTIQTAPGTDPRIMAAFGDILGLGRDATGAEVKQAIIEWLRGQVQDYERRQNMQTFSPAALSAS